MILRNHEKWKSTHKIPFKLNARVVIIFISEYQWTPRSSWGSNQVTIFLLTPVEFLTRKWIISNSRESYLSGVIRWNGCTFITFYIRRRRKACKNGFFLETIALRGQEGCWSLWDQYGTSTSLDGNYQVRLYGKAKDLNKNMGSCAGQISTKSALPPSLQVLDITI